MNEDCDKLFPLIHSITLFSASALGIFSKGKPLVYYQFGVHDSVWDNLVFTIGRPTVGDTKLITHQIVRM